jgi:hypothetical protein
MMLRPVAAVVAVILLSVGILALRDATLSTHQAVPSDSRIELIFRVASNNGEHGQTLDELAEALVVTCRLEVSSDPGPIEHLDGRRFRVVLRPSMDDTDQKQFRGCIEDWTIDHVRADVERLAPLS